MLVDDDFDESLDEGTTAHDIYAELILNDELIVTISKQEAESFRQRLISIKGKENAKLKAKGMPVDYSKLTISELPPAEDTAEGFVRLYLLLAKKKVFTITKVEAPSDF